MSKPSLPVIHNIAANLRRIRQQRGLTQDVLAQSAGVSRRMLVNIEAHESNVSFATLDRLANALSLSFAELVRPASVEEKSERPLSRPLRVWQDEHSDSHGTLLESVRFAGQCIELWHWQLAPGVTYEAEPASLGSQEMLYIISGELVLTLDGLVRPLVTGTSIAFASDQPYRFHNPGPFMLRFSKNVLLAAE
ncbi:helix-turn-helix domain-containing protein [Rivihabitans pingtungensis]|uniref:XRE family transcriptional regulator n=1 Tax=Rivihabitans pingtungensis TaxID=1054498 RepID=A0A318KWE9_9NEIS|nr:cupin domain-containing protein [Rivihabitans pingtungensis]PXX79996.1 XRE family transcriptional regulator [Rivihabitans pingtungensis]